MKSNQLAVGKEEAMLLHPRRQLLAATSNSNSERIVDIYDGEGRCKLQDSLSSLVENSFGGNNPSQNDDDTVTGVMFSVSAKTENIAILSFEFEYSQSFDTQTRELEVEIYTLQGMESSTGDYKQYVNQPEKWILYGAGVAIPDDTQKNNSMMMVTAIIPRDDMKQRSMTIPSGQTRSFYLTLKSKHLIVSNNSDQEEDQTSTTDVKVAETEFLEINTGGLALNGYGFPSDISSTLQDRAYRGIIHYQSIQDCTNFDTQTTIKIPFGVIDTNNVNFVFEEAIETLMNYNPKLGVMIGLHNLYLESIEVEELEERDDCTEVFHGTKEDEGNDNNIGGEGCTIYNGILNYQHLESLTEKQLEFELFKSFESTYNSKSDRESTASLELYYAGNSSFRRKYHIILEGINNKVILNPLQRSYIEDVTTLLFKMQEGQSTVNGIDNIPYEIAVIGQVIDFSSNRNQDNDNNGEEGEQRLLLRQRRQFVEHPSDGVQRRQLEPGSSEFITVESSIAGMGPGDDEEQYFQSIENTFSNNLDLYRDLLIKQQYRPNGVNDGPQNFGSIFETLQSVSFVRPPPPKPRSSGGSAANGDGLTTDQIQIIICSILLPIATLFFAYRIYVDCYRVDGQDKIKQHKLGHNEAKEEAAMEGKLSDSDRENALKKMDLFPKHSFVPPSPTEQSSSRTPDSSNMDSSTRSSTKRGRSVSPTRGIGISQSFSGGLFGSKKPESSRGRSRSPAARTTNRGRSRSPAATGTRRGRSRSPAATGTSRGRSFSPTQRRGRSPQSRAVSNSDNGGFDDNSFRVPSKSSREFDPESSFSVPLKSGDGSGHFVMASKASIETNSTHSVDSHSDHSRSFRVPSKSSVENTGASSSQKRQRREPTRGNLKKANTFGEVETVLRKKLSTINEQGQQLDQPRGRPEPPPRKPRSSSELGAFFSKNEGKPRRQSFASRSVGAPPPPKTSGDLDGFLKNDIGKKSNRRPSSSRSVGDARPPPPPPKGKTGPSSLPPPPPVKNKSKSKKNKKNSQEDGSIKSGKSKKSAKSKKSVASSPKSGKKAPKPLPVQGENGAAPTKNGGNGGTRESRTARKPRPGQRNPKKSKSADDIEPLPEMEKKGKKKKKVPPRKAKSHAGTILPASPKPYISKKGGKPAPPPVRVGMTGPQARP